MLVSIAGCRCHQSLQVLGEDPGRGARAGCWLSLRLNGLKSRASSSWLYVGRDTTNIDDEQYQGCNDKEK